MLPTPIPLAPFFRYLSRRTTLLGVLGLSGVILAALRSRGGSNDVEGLQQALESKTGLSVSAFVWEPSRSVIGDFLLGRPLLIEGRQRELDDDSSGQEEAATSEATTTKEDGRAPQSFRDIYRCFVRLSPEGKVLDVSAPRNLTRTSHSDEHGLTATKDVAMFWAETPSGAPTVSVLDFRGEAALPGNPAHSSWEARLQAAVGRWVDTGSWRGLGRMDFISTSPQNIVALNRSSSSWELTSEVAGRKTRATWKDGEPPRVPSSDLLAIVRNREPLPWLHFLANTGRKIGGKDAVAWAEGRYFSFLDDVRKTVHDVAGSSPSAPSPTSQASVLKTEDTLGFPPPPLRNADLERGESHWTALSSRLLPSREEPLLYRTMIHTDEERPYAELHLVAMDMRRLELGIGAGYEDPEPDSGPPGSGQIPNDPNVFVDVVATFNGAFKSVHGNYGMKAEGRRLVAPVTGAATVTVDRSGRTGFGTWSNRQDGSDFISFRQNLDPLIADGKVNPSKRTVWGDHLYGSGVAVERSALCLHESGHLIYAWATEATGLSLARGLKKAGCRYAIHLDMNPGHCSFAINKIRSISPLKAEGEVLDKRMKVNPTRYVRWSPKDFFYVKRRHGLPHVSPLQALWAWGNAPGRQPPPQSIPAIVVGSRTIGGIRLDLERIDMSRFSFTVEVGKGEPTQPPASTRTEASEVLAVWGLGHATLGNQTGLTIGENVISPLRRTFSSLVLEPGRPPHLLPPSEPLAEREGRTVLQLKTLARQGELLAEARELGGHRTRTAMCIDDSGNLYIGRIAHDTIAPLVVEMTELGCELVVELDRGSHSPSLVEKAGTESPPLVEHEQSVLAAREVPMKARTFTF